MLKLPDSHAPDPFASLILWALQKRPMYEGTVDPAVVAKRRARNKVARRSRARNRGRH